MRIAFFGDSFVNGTGDPLYQGWPGRVCARARTRGDAITAYNCGVRRATSGDVAATWLREAVFRLPDEYKAGVVFSFGANDRRIENGRPRVSVAHHIDNGRDILSKAAQRWPVLFITSPHVSEDIDEVDAAARANGMKDVCSQLGVPFLDASSASANFKLWPVETRAGDGIHPGAGGYGEMAEVIEAWPEWHAFLAKLRA